LIEITRFIKDDGPLTKHVHLTSSGALGNDSPDCRMARGTMIRERLDDWRAFAALIEATPRNVAFALGAMRRDLPETIRLVTKKDPQSGHPGFATRTKGTLLYPRGPALVLCDFDTKGMPAEVRSRLRELGGFLGALTKVCAGFGTAAHNALTGVTYPSHGQHLYVLVQGGSDARRFLYTLHDRCWLAGLGWYIVGNAGQLLERSIVDRMVCAPERLVFEASPDLEAPLRQERREAIIQDGPPLDTLAECRELSGIEQADLDRRKAEAARALGKETDAAKKAFVEDRVERAVAKGMDRDRARLMAEQWGKRILCPGVSLCFDDPDLGEIDVADVLRDPGLFDGATLADPIEGIKYGRNCAIIHGVQIFSFAHGGARYRLQHDYPSVKEAIEAAPETEACAIFVRLAIDADLDPAQEKLLAKAAGDRSGAGVKIAEKMLVAGRAQRHAAGAQAVRDKARSESSKERIEDFTPDGEIGPVMRLIDGILSGVDAPEPPMRDAEGWPIEVQCREAVGLHELTTNGANAEENAKSRLPSPKHFLLIRHERESLEIEWAITSASSRRPGTASDTSPRRTNF
jgi:hypothetical protein